MKKLYAVTTLAALSAIEWALAPARDERARRRRVRKDELDRIWRAQGFKDHTHAYWAGVSDADGKPTGHSALRPPRRDE
jgi:hypothetical protein